MKSAVRASRGKLDRKRRKAPMLLISIALCAAATDSVLVEAAEAHTGVSGEEAVGEIEILQVRPNLYMLSGQGGNVAVQVGVEGALVVDTLSGSESDKLIAAIKTISNTPIRWIINTSAEPDRVGGNAAVAKAGEGIRGGYVKSAIADASETADIVADERVLKTMSSTKPEIPFEAWPTSTFCTKSKDRYFNGEAIQILHMPNARSDGDSIVVFRRSDVIAVGDIVDTEHYPVVDHEHGGTMAGIIDALNKIIDIAVPAHTEEGGTLIIPGNGRVYDEADLVEYRDMLVIIRSFVSEMIKEGKSLDQVVRAKPTLAYDPRYGFGSDSDTTDAFVAAIYRELKQAKSHKSNEKRNGDA
jgi:cyclase